MTDEAVVTDLLRPAETRKRVRSPAGVVAMLDAGFPMRALDNIADAVAPDDRAFRFQVVKRATLHRREHAKAERTTLSAGESAKVFRLARVWALAREVWRDDGAARDFLRRPPALLENRPPIDIMMESEFGGPRVEQVLGRLQYGSAA